MAVVIEAKVKLQNRLETLHKIRALAEQESFSYLQCDYYFRLNNGTIKFRIGEGTKVEIISTRIEPPLNNVSSSCTNTKFIIENGIELLQDFIRDFEIIGVISKIRKVFTFGLFRLVFDDVEQFGSFLKVKVELANQLTIEKVKCMVRLLFLELKIGNELIIQATYFDMLLQFIEMENGQRNPDYAAV